MNKKQLAAINRVITALGGITKTAKRYNITTQAVQGWRRRGIPLKRMQDVVKDSGVPREEVWPHLYV